MTAINVPWFSGGVGCRCGTLNKLSSFQTAKPKSGGKGRPPTILTEAQVLEARALREFSGKSISVLARRYGTSDRYMRDLCDYVIRGNLIPNKSDLSSQPEAIKNPPLVALAGPAGAMKAS